MLANRQIQYFLVVSDFTNVTTDLIELWSEIPVPVLPHGIFYLHHSRTRHPIGCKQSWILSVQERDVAM